MTTESVSWVVPWSITELNPLMIYPYSNETQTRFDHGEFKVQLNQQNNPRPIGFCDGTPEDIAELHEIAESEGAENVEIHQKLHKIGTEILTLSEQL